MAVDTPTLLAVFITAALVRLDMDTTHSFSRPGWDLLACVEERWGDAAELVGYYLRRARNLVLNADDAQRLRGRRATRARDEALHTVRELLNAGLVRTTPTEPHRARWAEQMEPSFSTAYHRWRTSGTYERP